MHSYFSTLKQSVCAAFAARKYFFKKIILFSNWFTKGAEVLRIQHQFLCCC